MPRCRGLCIESGSILALGHYFMAVLLSDLRVGEGSKTWRCWASGDPVLVQGATREDLGFERDTLA